MKLIYKVLLMLGFVIVAGALLVGYVLLKEIACAFRCSDCDQCYYVEARYSVTERGQPEILTLYSHSTAPDGLEQRFIKLDQKGRLPAIRYALHPCHYSKNFTIRRLVSSKKTVLLFEDEYGLDAIDVKNNNVLTIHGNPKPTVGYTESGVAYGSSQLLSQSTLKRLLRMKDSFTLYELR